jgi:hypothetical protein
MKISKKDLRKIIFETVLQREKALNEVVSLRKMRKTIMDAQEEAEKTGSGDPIGDNPDVEKVIEDLNTFKGTSKGPFDPKNRSRAKEAEQLLQFAIEAKAGKKPPPPPPPATDTGATANPETTANTGDWKKYGDEKDWLYKIDGADPTQIWVTKKAVGNETVYQLNKPKYSVTVKKLDRSEKLPKRTQGSIKNDPALKPAAKPAAKANDENDTALTVTIKNLNNVLSGFTLPNVERLRTESTKYKAFEIKQDIASISDIIGAITGGGRGAYTNMNEKQKRAYIFLKLDDKNQVSSLAICSASPKGLNGMYFNSAGRPTGGLITDEEVKLEDGGKNSALADGSIWIPKILDGLDRIKSSTSESKVIYGKSHATLLRERYWGRY